MATSKKILVVDSSPDLLELSRILLSAEGYDVATSNYEDTTLAAIKKQAPEVILFDLVKDRHEPWALLAELRNDSETRDIGVMVTSATASLIERALSDPVLGVANGLLMPFDIDDLYARLEETFNHARISAPRESPLIVHDPAMLAMARLLSDERRNILFRWVQRISMLDAYRERGTLKLDDVVGEMGALLDSMVEMLGYHPGTTSQGAPLETGVLVSRHVGRRQGQGVGLADLCREYHILREEISRLLRGALHLWRLGVADMLLAQESVDAVIDHLIILSVEAYQSGPQQGEGDTR